MTWFRKDNVGGWSDWFYKEEEETMAVAKRGVEEMLATSVDWQKERLLKESYDQTRQLQRQVEGLQAAIRSIVLRLKVLDLDQMGKDMKVDGTVPLRFALSELRALVNAYDIMPLQDDSIKQYVTKQQWAQQQSATGIPSYYYGNYGNTTGGIKP